jgi:dTDP-D-glucose 4,6-dehydratase
MNLLVTGGAGFIGSAFARLMLRSPGAPRVVNLDKLTYAGNLENLEPVATHPNYRFVHGDICDAALVNALIAEERPDVVVHFAAESHVDRSIFAPNPALKPTCAAHSHSSKPRARIVSRDSSTSQQTRFTAAWYPRWKLMKPSR